MTIRHPRVKGFVYSLAALLVLCVSTMDVSTAGAQTAPDSLVLQKPEDVTVWREYDASRNQFTVWIRWQDIPDSLAAVTHQPDTLAWSLVTPVDSLSLPSTRGFYTGDIDRTVEFRATQGGVVGQDSIPITYTIRREEQWSGRVQVGRGYTPGSWIPIVFRNPIGETLDLGIELSFGPGESFAPGKIDAQSQFIVGLEDFEGFHIWRGIESDGSDLEVIGEISKEEAFRGSSPGGSVVDSLYFFEIIPDLRDTGVYNSPFSIDCIGFTLRAELEDDELFWFDCNAFNGFTYYYLVTSFDRGYSVSSGRQGLAKIDRCQPALGVILADSCRAEMVEMPMQVDPQGNLNAVYAVPNPFRTGGSRLTTENYHNFPDDKVRFVNVPTDCIVKIFTVSGDLVWEYDHVDSGGNIEWDTTNRGGESVTSGVYIYRIEDPGGGHVYGRLIIIR